MNDILTFDLDFEHMIINAWLNIQEKRLEEENAKLRQKVCIMFRFDILILKLIALNIYIYICTYFYQLI